MKEEKQDLEGSEVQGVDVVLKVYQAPKGTQDNLALLDLREKSVLLARKAEEGSMGHLDLRVQVVKMGRLVYQEKEDHQ